MLEHFHLLFGAGYDAWAWSYEEASSPKRRERMHDYLQEAAERIAAGGAAPVTPRLRTALLSADALAELAHDRNLVVMARRPLRLADPLALGSPFERLLKFGSSPLIAVRGYRWLYSRRRMPAPKHILVVLDGTADAECSLPAATAIAEATGATISLFRTVAAMPYYGIPCLEKEGEAQDYLDGVAASLRERRVPVESVVWTSDEAMGEVILSSAQRLNADLIAMTASLRRTLAGRMRRKPVQYLVRRSATPVLIVNGDRARS
ncbi:MAG: hypothetical protein DCC67_16190 [Planctomycetota bacterium]|nr:MAG: hypothetical protein DCC67_16190 [Planctomycetota bacterium]